jgi:hypothetical protein
LLLSCMRQFFYSLDFNKNSWRSHFRINVFREILITLFVHEGAL